VHLSRDITERKYSEDLLHKMLQLSKQIIAVTDGSGVGRLAPVSSLSEQEQSVLRMFSGGKNSAQVARETWDQLANTSRPSPPRQRQTGNP
jgi:DNA-binding NarL/FixJ family response regulator